MKRLYLILVLLFFAPNIYGGFQNDLNLSGLSYFDYSRGVYVGDQASFYKLVNELGVAVAPKLLSPATTLGQAGFELGLETSITPINANASYWKRSVEGGRPSDTLTIGSFRLRKGFPYSFEVGTSVSYIFLSQMFLGGVELKWAVNEGFYYLPDLGLRLAINRLFNAKDLDLTNGGLDTIISKTFGVGGFLQLTPYFAYTYLTVVTSRRTINATPWDSRDNGGSTNYPNDQFTFDSKWQWNHRFLFGLKIKGHIVTTYYEFALAPDAVNTHSFKIAADF
ncbi:MAG: hypothetical protein N2746_12210 [Deltaproteobacteria bacterium]|nr:hypothetical protein [Deltaproteobacteria bacterium]